MHPLLTRQLKRFFKEAPPALDGPMGQLLTAISDAYVAGDEERALLDRAVTESAKELEERNAALLFDIARRDRAEGERDAFFRTSADLLCIFDERLRYTQVSPSWEQSMGYSASALVGTECLALVHPEDRKVGHRMWAELQAAGKVTGIEMRVRAAAGDWRWTSWAASYDRGRKLIFGVGRDVTAERTMARELAQAQKLEAIGQLASGVAHEINTPVQFIGDNLSFLTDSMKDLITYLEAVHETLDDTQRAKLEPAAKKADLEYLREEVPRSLSESKDGVRRVAELVRALKEFAHPDKPELEHADLNRALERSLVLARGELKHVAKVETDFQQLPALRCHVGGLSQVFLNLLVNAAHAIEERAVKQPGSDWVRCITVKTRHVGDEVLVSISDTGNGIPAELRERIFEPFFTTKPVGKGSGQGLPLVRNVVIAQHQGRVELESEVGVGTTFTLRLPLEQKRQEAA